ncbi:Metallo-dependent phosphatase-like protein [Kalaharituber pfeilii]|nr:Metallo-dependent phosphatase-like protein [Kalaharituber pfeilii]
MSEESFVTYASGATGPPDLRFLHYNDVYHISAGSQEPIGGAARFVAVANHYRNAPEFAGLPPLLTFFSGDAFNPSIESSVAKGRHMVPILNLVKTDVACLGNHDLDFGVEQFMHLAKQCEFQWLCANVEDPAVGGPIASLNGTCMLESNGIKIGVIGLVEREWLDTIFSLPPNLKFTSAIDKALELVPGLRAAGADIIVAVSHQREPNDVKLAESIPEGLIDIILGGHDHHYAHQVINGCHVLRSGSDFKHLSYIEVRRKSQDESVPGWNFDIIRRDITGEIQEDEETVAIVEKLSSGLRAKLEKPVGSTSVSLDARFTVIRAEESNMGNFVADLLRYYYSADCAIIAAGSIRGDQIYPPGVLKLMDIIACFPFEDPVVVVKLPGSGILEALENGLSKLPALEGRFPQVSNIFLTYDPSRQPGSRILSCKIGSSDIVPGKLYTCATRAYMVSGKDGYTALTTEAGAELVVDEENGLLISMIIRQYFLSLKVIGKWRRGGAFRQFFGAFKQEKSKAGQLVNPKGVAPDINDDDVEDSHSDDEEEEDVLVYDKVEPVGDKKAHTMNLVKSMGVKWARLAGVKENTSAEEFVVDWTRSVAPRVEGRIKVVSRA